MAKPKTEWRFLVYLTHMRSMRPGEREELKSQSGLNPQDWFRWDGARRMFVYQARALTLAEYRDLIADSARQDRLAQVGYGMVAKTPRCYLSVEPIEVEIDVLAEKTLDRKQLRAASPELAS